jgi:hypothetical protein
MTTRLAEDDPQTLHAATIGAAWLAVAELGGADSYPCGCHRAGWPGCSITWLANWGSRWDGC